MVQALRNPITESGYKAGDVLVLFGELFARGYANGIVEEAERNGLTVIRTTVGRRTEDGQLRALFPEEMSTQNKPFINIPLEAGFDLTPSRSGNSPADLLKGVRLNEWLDAKLDFKQIEESREIARADFQERVRKYIEELKKVLPAGKNILFVHTMAGGVPRAKIVMPAMNRVFKGRGDRFVASKDFWNSDIGRLSAMNFEEVTANTFQVLLNETAGIRDEAKKDGRHISYVAYGYHGTETLIDGEYRWQTYTPYLQGWAKLKLEQYAQAADEKGISACVYNCPEILTNSSSIFQGLEVSLYPLLGALRKEGSDSPAVQSILKQCLGKLQDGYNIDRILAFTDAYMNSDIIQTHSVYERWPQHNSVEQMEKMMTSSEELISWHKNPKDLCNYMLSEEVFKATGTVMFHDSWRPAAPVQWLGHDVLAKEIARQE